MAQSETSSEPSNSPFGYVAFFVCARFAGSGTLRCRCHLSYFLKRANIYNVLMVFLVQVHLTYPSEGQKMTIVCSGGLNLLCALQYCFIFLLASDITAVFVLVSEHMM